MQISLQKTKEIVVSRAADVVKLQLCQSFKLWQSFLKNNA